MIVPPDGRGGFVIWGYASALGDEFVLTGDLLLELCHEERGENTGDAEDDEHPAHGRGEQAAYVSAADTQRTAQTLFADGAENEREDDCRRVQIKLTYYEYYMNLTAFCQHALFLSAFLTNSSENFQHINKKSIVILIIP